MTDSRPDPADVPDVSAAYHLWDELFAACLRVASSSSEGDLEGVRARERLVRGHARSLEERDAAWARIFRTMRSPDAD